MSDKGIHLAALYSVGCPELVQMGYEATMELFAGSETSTTPSIQEVKSILEKLDPSVYCQLIAGVIGEKDYFSESVVRAHWLGADILCSVQDANVQQVFANSSLRDCFDIHKLAALAMKLRGLIGVVPHHNFCVLQLFTELKKRSTIPERLVIDADRCLVKSGKVLSSTKDFLEVQTLVLFPAEEGGIGADIGTITVNRGFVTDQAVTPSFVTIHLGRARQAISGDESQRLTKLTIQAVKFSNKER